MEHINLGTLEVGRIGLGTMGMSTAYTGAGSDDAESIRAIHRALELGVTLIDTAEIYGPYRNEELVGRAISGRRDQVVLATKFGMVSHPGGGPGTLDSSPGEHPHRPGGLPPEARSRPHRPLLPAPGRPEHTHRGHGGSTGRAGHRGQDPPRGAVRGRTGHHPPGPRRPPDHRAADRVLAVDQGPRAQDAARAEGAGHRARGLLAVGPGDAHGDGALDQTIWPIPTSAGPTRASPSRTSSTTCAAPGKCGPSPRRSGARRPRSRWPGCWPRETTSPRSPVPNGCPGSRRTWPPTTSG